VSFFRSAARDGVEDAAFEVAVLEKEHPVPQTWRSIPDAEVRAHFRGK